MLNRRHLRIKVFQAIYAYSNGEKQDLGAAERELNTSIDRIYELFIYSLSVLSELKSFAEKQIEDRKLKRLPTEEDLNPNLKFVNNKALNIISNNKYLQKKCEQLAVNWVDNQEMIKKIFLSVQESDMYVNYMDDAAQDFDQGNKSVWRLRL